MNSWLFLYRTLNFLLGYTLRQNFIFDALKILNGILQVALTEDNPSKVWCQNKTNLIILGQKNILMSI